MKVLVLGGGPAGTTTALQAGELGADITLVEASGSAAPASLRARRPIPGAELARTYDGLRDLTRLPASVAVIASADTGCQLASILDDFGAQVTLVEASPRLVPPADGSPRFRRLRGLRVVRIGSP